MYLSIKSSYREENIQSLRDVKRNIMPCDQESSSFYSSEVDRNLLRVSRPRATTDPAISGSEQSKRDSRLTRSNSACGLDSVELELDFVFTSSSDSKQLDFGQGYLVGSRLEPDFEYPPLGREKISRELTFCERSAKSAAARCEQAIQSRANGVVEIVHVAVEYTLRDEVVGRFFMLLSGIIPK
ncbi:unnamed protein product [Microthlaspi erraticum]|uniref:Uncharacterized protein n=1 Tax=Microthlaspi erraticum TaxID=1685480 RepID=A0A6D2JNS8_9BRAS|nr:unnamed protein product [Microthlaspi erraticum]